MLVRSFPRQHLTFVTFKWILISLSHILSPRANTIHGYCWEHCSLCLSLSFSHTNAMFIWRSVFRQLCWHCLATDTLSFSRILCVFDYIFFTLMHVHNMYWCLYFFFSRTQYLIYTNPDTTILQCSHLSCATVAIDKIGSKTIFAICCFDANADKSEAITNSCEW